MKPIGRPGWPLVAAMIVATAALASGATVFATDWKRTYDPEVPPILRDLHGTWDAAAAEFTARLRAHYPVGSSEEALIGGISDDGFHPVWRATGASREAERTWSAYPCQMRAAVLWQADAEGKIARITGWYHEIGCL